MSSRAVRRVTIVPGEQTQIWGPADSIQAAITLSLGLRSGDVVMCRVACLIMHDYASYEWLTKIFAEGAKTLRLHRAQRRFRERYVPLRALRARDAI